MSDTTCLSCRARVHEGTHLCSECTRKLARTITNTGAHYADLDTLRTRAKGIRYDLPKGKGGKRENPLGADFRFMRPTSHGGRYVEGWATVVIHHARNTATTWARVCLDHWPNLRMPADNVPAVCAFIASITTAIAGQPWSDEMFREFETIERRLERLVDLAPERVFAGKCWVPDEYGDCQQDLYARAGQTEIVCVRCGAEHQVEERRKQLLAEVGKMNVTATEAAIALAAWSDLGDHALHDTHTTRHAPHIQRARHELAQLCTRCQVRDCDTRRT